ncbi:MAG: hypothetical protein JSV32_03380, partial [Dehalococcoidia bacterium]
MRISRTGWLLIGTAIFVICAVVLFMFYQNQANTRQEARDELEVAQDTSLMLVSQRGAMEADLVEKENELAQWEDTIGQLNVKIAQLEISLGNIQQEFPISAESIEYDETLFSYAFNNQIELFSVSTSEIDNTDIEGINYGTVTFGIGVRGEVDNILDFVNTVVSSDDFKTAVFAPVKITIPDPLDDEEKYFLEQTLREDLTAEALAKIPTGNIVLFTLEAIDEVAGNEYIDQLTNGDNGSLEANSLTKMAEILKDRITGSIYLETEYEGPLASDLAELLEQGLADSVVNAVIIALTQEIENLVIIKDVVGEEGEEEIIIDQNALEELVGKDLATLIGEEV